MELIGGFEVLRFDGMIRVNSKEWVGADFMFFLCDFTEMCSVFLLALFCSNCSTTLAAREVSSSRQVGSVLGSSAVKPNGNCFPWDQQNAKFVKIYGKTSPRHSSF